MRSPAVVLPTGRARQESSVPEATVIPLEPRDGREARARRSESRTADKAADTAVEPPTTEPADWERKVAGALAFLRRRFTGDYEIDDFGFDADLTDSVLLPPLRPLYEKWFRVETRGLDNVPDTGGALIVANHSGTIPVDALMTTLALHDHHPAHRHLRLLGADLVFTMPIVAPLARKGGNTLACNADAERLLNGGNLVGVFPEGFKGIGKPFSERYKLQRFGRGGFVSAALRTGSPIIPCSIVGAEEIYPMVGNAKTLARLLGMPYLPITPFFPLLGPIGAIPLPSKWIIEFGEPIETKDLGGPAAAEDPMLVFNLTDQVRETIQSTLYTLLMQRRSVFF
ncbi:MAG: acyltransferase family protein [Frankiaceae bacterium]|nr:acyltransferase family protein [Frankiaceae bacterium]